MSSRMRGFGMRSFVLPLAAICVFVFALCPAAQQSPSAPPQEPAKTDTAKDKEQDQKDKKEKKKKKDKTSADPYDSAAFSQAVANNVLNDLRDGLEGHSQ